MIPIKISFSFISSQVVFLSKNVSNISYDLFKFKAFEIFVKTALS